MPAAAPAPSEQRPDTATKDNAGSGADIVNDVHMKPADFEMVDVLIQPLEDNPAWINRWIKGLDLAIARYPNDEELLMCCVQSKLVGPRARQVFYYSETLAELKENLLVVLNPEAVLNPEEAIEDLRSKLSSEDLEMVDALIQPLEDDPFWINRWIKGLDLVIARYPNEEERLMRCVQSKLIGTRARQAFNDSETLAELKENLLVVLNPEEAIEELRSELSSRTRYATHTPAQIADQLLMDYMAIGQDSTRQADLIRAAQESLPPSINLGVQVPQEVKEFVTALRAALRTQPGPYTGWQHRPWKNVDT